MKLPAAVVRQAWRSLTRACRGHAWLLLCAWLTCLATTPASALDPDRTIFQLAHSTWTNLPGFPDSIRTIEEGTDGYLWLGSDVGLYRFDGVTFERFDGDDSLPLKGLRVTQMVKAPDGSILAIVGLRVVRIKDGKAALLPLTGWPPDRDQFAVDLDGVYWVKTRTGALWRVENGKGVVMDASWKYPFAAHTDALLVDRRGGLWALGHSSDRILVHLARGAREFTIACHTDAVDIGEGIDGAIWLSGIDGLSVIPAGAPASTKPLVLSTDPYSQAKFDRDGGLWIQARDGLAHIGHPETLLRGGAMEIIRSQTMTPEKGLTADVIWQVFEDHEGNIWTGTSKGLDRFRATTIAPVTLPRRSLDFALAPATDGAVWAANFNGDLMRVDGQQIVDVSGVGPAIDELCSGANGGTWVVARNNRVWHSIRGGAFEMIEIPRSFAYRYTLSCMEDAKGDLWIGFPNGIGKIAGGKWAGLQSGNGLPEGQIALRMMTDRKGRFWISGLADLNVIDDGKNRVLFNQANGLPNGRVRLLYEKSHLWVATEQGVAIFDGERFHELKHDNGQTFGYVNGLVEASNGDLWMQSQRMAWRISAAELARALPSFDESVHAEHFDALDGLKGVSNSNPHPSMAEGSDGRLWFATNAGIAWVDPAKVQAAREIPAVRIQTLVADGTKVPFDAATPLPKLTERIEIGLTSMVLGAPEKVRFRYRLDGSPVAWTELVNQHSAVFTNLRPGRHHFEVAAKFGDGQWSKTTAYEFRIDPAWYQTYWFYALCVLPFLGLLWLFHRMRLRQATAILRLQMDAKQSERERIARDLHDTLLQTVYGLMLRFEAVADHFLPSDPKRQLMNEALDHADRSIIEGRDRLSALRNTIEVGADLTDSLRKVGEELARDHPSTSFLFNVRGASGPLKPLVESEIRMIIIEALTNAFRHANAKSVLLEISSARDLWSARIKDDGIGIEEDLLKSGRTQHWGMQGMRERAQLIGAKIEMISVLDEGTEIRISLAGKAPFT